MLIGFGLRFAARFLGSPIRQRDLRVRSSSRPLAAPNTNGTRRGLALWRTPKSLRRPRLLPTRTARLIPTDLFCDQNRLALKTRFTISRLRRLLSSAEALQRAETRAGRPRHLVRCFSTMFIENMTNVTPHPAHFCYTAVNAFATVCR